LRTPPKRSAAALALSTLSRGLLALVVSLTAAYAAWPMWTAFELKRAIRVADTRVLEQKIEWEGVRASLRRSLQADMLGTSAEAAAGGLPAPRHGLWQRIKTSLGERAVDSFIDTYITPEGLPLIARYRAAFREQVKLPAADLRGRLAVAKNVARGRLGLGIREASSEPVKPFWQRIEHAAFTSIDRFEITLTHPDHPGKLIVSELSFRSDEWKLTSLTLKPLDAAAGAAAD